MKWLIRLYPGEWRRRYGEEFSALLAEEGASPRIILDVALGALDARMWLQVGREARASAPQPHRAGGHLPMTRMHSAPSQDRKLPFAGLILLLPTLLLLFTVFSKFVLGIDPLYDAYDRFYTDPLLTALRPITDIVTVLGPFLALAVCLLPVLTLHVRREERTVAGSVSVTAGPFTLAVLAVSLVCVGIVLLFGFVEHFEPR